MDCVIVDIDGTLANIEHRLHFIKNGNRDWDGFFENLHNDKLITETHTIVQALNAIGYSIVLCTGRQWKYVEQTMEWLEKHNVPFDEIFMRGTGDFREDSIIKEELLSLMKDDGWNPLFVIDDRQRVVDMWRRNGLICFQAGPDFDMPLKGK